MEIDIENILREVQFKTSRSGGAGGQNVNKVSSKVELVFDIRTSFVLTDSQKGKLLEKLAGKLDSEGLLHVVSQISRSQPENKKIAADKLLKILENGLKVTKKRIATKPRKGAKEARLNTKKRDGEIKKLRGGKPDWTQET
jgi:ribosome-associated protein